jgi:hypothetical protein
MIKTILRSAVSLSLVAALGAGCGDDSANMASPDAAGSGSDIDAADNPMPTYKQVEQLARPGIAEALLLSDGFLAGYNATAPTFTGVDSATLGMVVGEAKTVLKAVYLGVCLVNGVAGLTADNGAHPAGLACAAVGTDLFSDAGGTVLTAEALAGAQAYADKVFGQFEPDVMRIDTSAASGYLTLCGDADSTPLLCGGRKLDDDVIDITYFYLLAGASVPSGLAGNVPQAVALTQDGVSFDGNNSNQGHPAVSDTFPYSAPPI